MPEIAVAANTVAVANAQSTSPGTAGGAPDGQDAGLFAALLKQQLTDPAAAQASALAAILQAGQLVSPPVPAGQTAADASTSATDPATLLPMLMGTAGKPGSPVIDTVDAAKVRKAVDQLQAEDPVPTGDGVIAAPIAIVPVATTLPPDVAASTATAMPATTPAATAMPATTAAVTANLAATTVADAPVTAVDKREVAALLPAEGSDVRAAGLPPSSSHVAPSVTTPTEVVSRQVDTPVGKHGWDGEVGNQLVWMSANHTSRAELVLNPPQMGKIEISLTMSGDHATASFVSASPEVRAAIEDALPRLREILADAGVTLGQTQVGAESSRQWTGTGENADNSLRNPAVGFSGTSLHGVTTGASVWGATGRGLVDVFA